MDDCAHANELDAGHPWADTVQRHHADSAFGADACPGGSLPDQHRGRSKRLLPFDRARGGGLHRLGGLATGAAKRAAFQPTAPLTTATISAAALAVPLAAAALATPLATPVPTAALAASLAAASVSATTLSAATLSAAVLAAATFPAASLTPSALAAAAAATALAAAAGHLQIHR